MRIDSLPVMLACASITVDVLAVRLPVVQDVDVVVAGGSSAAVAAAVAAKQAGATVFLAAPRPYLGEDLAGTLRLARVPGDDESHPIYRAIFDGRRAARANWPFAYTYDAKPDKQHDDAKHSVLTDGKFGNATLESVQFSGDVTVSVDLGEARDISGVELSTYLREHKAGKNRNADLSKVGFRTAAMEVSASRDGKTWSLVSFSDKPAVMGTTNSGILSVPISGTWRYLRVRAVRDPAYPRQLLGELRVLKGDSAVDELVDRTTPIAVKRTLDEALLAAGVPYLTGAVPCGLLKDEDDRACGIVIADRSGRQAIRAKVIIDAMPRGRIARLAGAEATFKAGTRTFSRIVLSGERPKSSRVRATQLPGDVPVTVKNIRSKRFPNDFTAHFWKCEMDVDMPDDSARSFAEAEQALRDATFTPLQADAANTAVLADEPALRVPDGKPVFVLAPCAFPGKAITVGAQTGTAAAKTAKGIPAPSGQIYVYGALPGEKLLIHASAARVGEHAKALPSYLVKASGTVADVSPMPLLATCDTFVVGAGTGGGPAGISAARAGAKTIVCEYVYMMGGVSTDGLIGHYYYGNRVGFTREIDAGVQETGAVFPQAKSEWYRREQRRAGAEIWFGTMLQGVVVYGSRVIGVVVVMPDGTRGAVRCSNVVDATGNAEIPALVGTDTEFITDEDLSVQGATMARNTLGTGYANSDLGFVDDTDAADVFYFALRTRASMPDGTWDQAQVVNSRERRRMVGAFYMTPPDVMNGRTYPDTVVRTYSNFDSHGQTAHDAFFIEDPGHKPMYVNLPYRCFLPKTLDGVLVTGLGISAHRDAMPILRMEPDVQNQGYVAGYAAASAVKAGVTVRNVDMKALQKHLVEKKIIGPDVPKQKDSFPLSDEAFAKAVHDLADNYKGLAVLMTDPDRARPLLARAYATAEGESKFNYAHLLAMLGRDDGAALVLAKFKAMDWDKGWNYRGMGQYNRSVSWVDSYAIALGHAKVRAAVPALIEKADQLTEKSEYSHFRAIARALEEIGDPSAAPALARVLKRPGIGGRAQKMQAKVPVFEGFSNRAGDWERTLSLREICIARALYRLGDTPDGLGRRTLEAYAADPRRAFAAHACLVLKQQPTTTK